MKIIKTNVLDLIFKFQNLKYNKKNKFVTPNIYDIETFLY